MSQEISNYPLLIPSYYYDMGYQIPPFFVALTPDMNGHCDIDDSYYAYLNLFFLALTVPF